ncbi:MAG: hypothetical protein M2R45_02278 [Verrucomicrobia subdivision 3 bacterium]|nr:hypothetical protein [Limisphaerales bacterium]MCS1414657.1 hypothetical protein [Limisphaerales bacterium]
MIHIPFLRSANLFILLALALGPAAARIQAGERVIFSNPNSKIRIPQEELDARIIAPDFERFDKKSSSVEGVMAPWQNPLNPSPNLRQRENFLKALDRQKNWMLQDPDELLNSKNFSSEIDFDEIDFTSSRQRYGRAERSTFEKYYAKRETQTRPRTRESRSQQGYDFAQDNAADEKSTNDKKDRNRDAFATPEHFEVRFDSVFDQPLTNVTSPKAKTGAAEDLIEQTTIESRVEGFTDDFTDLGIRTQTPEATSQEFEKLLNTMVDLTDGAHPSVSAGIGLPSIAGSLSNGSRPNINPVNTGIQSGMMEGLRATIGSGMRTSSAIKSTISSSVFGNSGIDRSSGVSDGDPATPSVFNRPAVFQLPERSF